MEVMEEFREESRIEESRKARPIDEFDSLAMVAIEAQASCNSDSSKVFWRCAGDGPSNDRKLPLISLLAHADRIPDS